MRAAAAGRAALRPPDHDAAPTVRSPLRAHTRHPHTSRAAPRGSTTCGALLPAGRAAVKESEGWTRYTTAFPERRSARARLDHLHAPSPLRRQLPRPDQPARPAAGNLFVHLLRRTRPRHLCLPARDPAPRRRARRRDRRAAGRLPDAAAAGGGALPPGGRRRPRGRGADARALHAAGRAGQRARALHRPRRRRGMVASRGLRGAGRMLRTPLATAGRGALVSGTRLEARLATSARRSPSAGHEILSRTLAVPGGTTATRGSAGRLRNRPHRHRAARRGDLCEAGRTTACSPASYRNGTGRRVPGWRVHAIDV